jgi:hypothetical protein
MNRDALLLELARCFARAAVNAFIREQAEQQKELEVKPESNRAEAANDGAARQSPT